MEEKRTIDWFYTGQDIQIQINHEDPSWYDEYGHLLIEYLFDELGDGDLVETNEINGNAGLSVWTDSNQNVFHWYNEDISNMKKTGISRLYGVGTLRDNLDLELESHRDFLIWWFGVSTLEEALVKLL